MPLGNIIKYMIKNKVQTVIYLSNAQKEKQFLLLKMNKKRDFFWQNVTGSVDEGEDFKSAALREAIEETGLSSDNIQQLRSSELEFTFVDQWEKSVLEKVFYLEAKTSWSVQIDPSEHCDFKWVEQSQIQRNSVYYESNFTALKYVMDNL